MTREKENKRIMNKEKFWFPVSPYIEVPESVKTKIISAFGPVFQKSITVRERNGTRKKLKGIGDIKTTDHLFRVLNRNGIGENEFKQKIELTDTEKKTFFDPKKEMNNWINHKNIITLKSYGESEYYIKYIDDLLLKKKINKREYLEIVKILKIFEKTFAKRLSLEVLDMMIEQLWEYKDKIITILEKMKANGNIDNIVKFLNKLYLYNIAEFIKEIDTEDIIEFVGQDFIDEIITFFLNIGGNKGGMKNIVKFFKKVNINDIITFFNDIIKNGIVAIFQEEGIYKICSFFLTIPIDDIIKLFQKVELKDIVKIFNNMSNADIHILFKNINIDTIIHIFNEIEISLLTEIINIDRNFFLEKLNKYQNSNKVDEFIKILKKYKELQEVAKLKDIVKIFNNMSDADIQILFKNRNIDAIIYIFNELINRDRNSFFKKLNKYQNSNEVGEFIKILKKRKKLPNIFDDLIIKVKRIIVKYI